MASDDDIPTLDQVVRHGSERRSGEKQQPARKATMLDDAEIEAIAERVMDRYSAVLEKTIARAIRRALERKDIGSPGGERG